MWHDDFGVSHILQTEKEDVPVLLVGGGSILVDCTVPLKGASKVVVPAYWVQPSDVASCTADPSPLLPLGCCQCSGSGLGHSGWSL